VGWEIAAGGTALALTVIGVLVGVSKRWGSSETESEASKKEAKDAKARLAARMGTPTPDQMARVAAARRRLRALRKN